MTVRNHSCYLVTKGRKNVIHGLFVTPELALRRIKMLAREYRCPAHKFQIRPMQVQLSRLRSAYLVTRGKKNRLYGLHARPIEALDSVKRWAKAEGLSKTAYSIRELHIQTGA